MANKVSNLDAKKMLLAPHSTFQGKNKSAVLTQLMQQAIEGRKREDQRKRAIDYLLAMRGQNLRVTTKAIRQARVQGPP